MLDFVASSVDNEEKSLSCIVAYELSKDFDAACDGLRINLADKAPFDEIKGIKAYNNGKLVFNGYVDAQRESVTNGTYQCFIYARSSASILLDNEAEPRSYICPTALALFRNNAKDFGFKLGLPTLSSDNSYLVNKGVSCFGAINSFVYGITGKNIFVTPENEIVLSSDGAVINFDDLTILSEKRMINRGGLISQVDYKIDGDNKYLRHTKSRFLEAKGIKASKKINLSNYPLWQRENIAKAEIQNSAEGYNQFEITVLGSVTPQLYSKAVGKSSLGELDGFYVSNVCTSLNKNGEQTKITLSKTYDLEEISYVAE